MTCNFELSISQDKEPELYQFLSTLPQPSENLIQFLPCGFHYVVLTTQEIGDIIINIATLYCKK
jgi:hypothetical protein